MSIKNPQGEDIGHVEELLVDVRDGRVGYAILSFGGVLGIGDKLFPIPWRELTLKYDEGETYFVVDVSSDFLDRAPSFDRDRWPEITEDWTQVIDSLFPRHAGVVVATSDDRLRMTYVDGSGEHEHAVAVDARVTRDGQESKLRDLQPGDEVTVTTEERAGIRLATQIEARSQRQ